jgi:hypothetical protein
VSAALAALGLVALGAAQRERWRAALLPLLLWFAGTPLADVGPGSFAAAFAIAAIAGAVPRLAGVPAALVGLFAGAALAAPALRELDAARIGVGLFAVQGGILFRSPLPWVALAGSCFAPRCRAATGAGALALGLAAALPDAAAAPLLGAALALLFAGFAAATGALAAALRRRPAMAPGAVLGVLTLWNVLSMESYRRWLVPRDDTVAFADFAFHNAAILRSWVGAPPAWPANAFFGARHGLVAARWDRLATAYALEPWPGLGHEVALAGPGFEVDGLLDGGWGARVPCPPESCRNLNAEAVVYFQLRQPSRLALGFEARGPGSIDVSLDGFALGRLETGEALSRHTLRPPFPLRAGLRELTLRPLGAAKPRVARVFFLEER